LRKLIRNFLL